MTTISPSPPAALDDLRNTVRSMENTLRIADEALAADLAAKEAAKKHKSPIDELEDKVMATTAIAAAASGTPEQAKDMLAKARAKALRAAADGADTASLEAMVRQMERLARIAEERHALKRRDGGVLDDAGAAAIPILTAVATETL